MLQLDSVCLNDRKAFGEFQLDSDLVVLRFATRESNNLQNRLINVQAVLARRRFLDESADSTEDVSGTIAVGHNATKRVVHLLHIGWRCTQPAQRSMRVRNRRYVVTGRLNKEIAGDLGISEITVKVHRAQVVRKMNADSLPELARMADKLKLAAHKPHTT